MARGRKSTIVEVPLDFFYGIVLDYEAYPSFSKDVQTARVVERDGDTATVEFTIKVLLRSFDYCLRMVAEPPNVMRWSLVRSGTLGQNDGGWELRELSGGRVQVTYWNEVAAKRFLPKAFINALASLALPRMLKEWKAHAELLWAQRPATD